MIPEREREALMRLTMCARKEGFVCKYKDSCNFDFQFDLATKNMNILADALIVAGTPQTDLLVKSPRKSRESHEIDTPQEAPIITCYGICTDKCGGYQDGECILNARKADEE